MALACWLFHQYGSWRLTYRNVPCEATKTCERCGYVKYGLDHDFDYHTNDTRGAQCKRCGYHTGDDHSVN